MYAVPKVTGFLLATFGSIKRPKQIMMRSYLKKQKEKETDGNSIFRTVPDRISRLIWTLNLNLFSLFHIAFRIFFLPYLTLTVNTKKKDFICSFHFYNKSSYEVSHRLALRKEFRMLDYVFKIRVYVVCLNMIHILSFFHCSSGKELHLTCG